MTREQKLEYIMLKLESLEQRALFSANAHVNDEESDAAAYQQILHIDRNTCSSSSALATVSAQTPASAPAELLRRRSAPEPSSTVEETATERPGLSPTPRSASATMSAMTVSRLVQGELYGQWHHPKPFLESTDSACSTASTVFSKLE